MIANQGMLISLRNQVYEQRIITDALDRRVSELINWKEEAISEADRKQTEFDNYREEVRRERGRKQLEFDTFMNEQRDKQEKMEARMELITKQNNDMLIIIIGMQTRLQKSEEKVAAWQRWRQV